MKIFKNFFKNNQKINASEIAFVYENKGITLDSILKTMVELKSNDKGTYFKLNNGIMVCFGLQEFNVNFKDYWTNMKATDQLNITYPTKFADPTYAYLTIGYGDNNWIGIQETSDGNAEKSQSFRVYRPPVQGDGSAKVKIQYLAIGKWK